MKIDVSQYEDIINLPHHVSKKYPQMPVTDRAAQFSPFAALTGYEDAIRETERRTEEKIELDDYTKEELNKKLMVIKENLNKNPEISVKYFIPDEKKEGGTYVNLKGIVKKIDEYRERLVFMDGTEVPLDDIIEIVERDKL